MSSPEPPPPSPLRLPSKMQEPQMQQQILSSSQIIRRIFTPKRIRVLKKMGAGVAVSSVPVFIWWKWAVDERHKKEEDVRTRVRVPNVQNIDDLMIERCRPGDV